MQGSDDLFERSSGQVGASDAAGEERVAGDQHLLGGEIQADAAFGVPGRVENIAERFPARRV